MRILAVEAEGFMGYQDPVRVDFPEAGVVAVVGPNGAGKSALVTELPDFTLFRKFRTKGLDEIISTASDQATTAVEFALNGDIYRVVRKQPRKGRAEAILYAHDPDEESQWRPLTEKEVTATTEAIANLIGMDFDAASTTWIAHERDYGRFANAGPTDRRALLATIFGLDRYDGLASKAEHRHKAAWAQMKELDARLAELAESHDEQPSDGPLADLSDDAVEKVRADAEAEVETLNAKIAAVTTDTTSQELENATDALKRFREEQRRDINAADVEVRHATQTANTARKALNEAQAFLDTVSDAKWSLPDAEENLATTEARIGETEQRLTDLTGSAGDFVARLAEIKARGQMHAEQEKAAEERLDTLRTTVERRQGQCFTCGQPLTAEHAQTILDEQTNARDKAASARSETRAEYAKVQAEQRDCQRHTNAQREELNAVRTAARKAQAEVARLKERAASAKDAERRQQEAQAAAKKADQTLEDAEAGAATARAHRPAEDDLVAAAETAKKKSEEAESRAEAERNDLRSKRSTAQDSLRSAEREQYARDEALRRKKCAEARQADLESQRRDASKESRLYSALWDAFSPSGIPSMILAGVVGELNDDINAELDTLSGGELTIDIRTQRETKAKRVREEVLVYVGCPDGVRSYESLSNGQRFRVDLAVRIGLSRTIARRTGVPIRTLIVDEGWGALDEEGRMAAVETLTRLGQEFNVLTVSHVEDVRAAFSTLIEVENNGGTSEVTVTGT